MQKATPRRNTARIAAAVRNHRYWKPRSKIPLYVCWMRPEEGGYLDVRMWRGLFLGLIRWRMLEGNGRGEAWVWRLGVGIGV